MPWSIRREKWETELFTAFRTFVLLAGWGCKLQRKPLFIRELSRSLFIFTREEPDCGIEVLEEIWVPVLTLVQGSYTLNLSWSWSLMSSNINPQAFSWAIQSQFCCPLDCFHGLQLRETYPQKWTANTYSLICLPTLSSSVIWNLQRCQEFHHRACRSDAKLMGTHGFLQWQLRAVRDLRWIRMILCANQSYIQSGQSISMFRNNICRNTVLIGNLCMQLSLSI